MRLLIKKYAFNSERSEVPTRVLFALAWLPTFFKNVALSHQSTTVQTTQFSFSVLHQIANLLPSIIRPCNAPFGSTDSTPLKNCAPPLNPVLRCHRCGPHFTTTGIVVDNQPTPWICQTDNIAKIRLTVWV